MHLLLIALISLLTLSSVFDWDPGPAPGVKLKNAILYLLALGLLLRASVSKDFRLELGAIPAAFAVLIVYAIVSFVAVVMVIKYPYYDTIDNALILKSLVDQMLFFLVFFYGLRTEGDALRMLKFLCLAFALSHLMAVLDAQGVVSFGDLERREDGRVQGLVGESNQYGAFAAMSLPAVIAVAFATRGLERLLWLAATIVTMIALVMTVSRGAFVATFVATVAIVLMFRRYARPGRIAVLTLGAAGVAVAIIAAAIGLGYGELLYERVIGSSGGDLGATSSGRTEIWAKAIGVMFEEPLTLVTGFGWRAYWSMPFRYSPHNHYLNLWFNLGLVGLFCSVFLFAWPIRIARAAASRAFGAARAALVGFVAGAIALAAATFFVDLSSPWLYFWAYAGVAMRLAVAQRMQISDTAVAAAPTSQGARAPDPFGWRGRLSASRIADG